MNWRDAWGVLRGRKTIERGTINVFLHEKVDGGVRLSCVYVMPVQHALRLEEFGSFVELPSPNPNAVWRVWVER